MSTTEYKTCARCGQSKPVSAYYLKKRRNGQRTPQARCKDCHRETIYASRTTVEWRDYMRDYRGDSNSEARARQRESNRTSYWRHHAARRAGAKETEARHPERVVARELLKNAVRRGDIVPEPCLFCGESQTNGHHHDYSKPLIVTWLCSYHRGLVHRQVDQP